MVTFCVQLSYCRINAPGEQVGEIIIMWEEIYLDIVPEPLVLY